MIFNREGDKPMTPPEQGAIRELRDAIAQSIKVDTLYVQISRKDALILQSIISKEEAPHGIQ